MRSRERIAAPAVVGAVIALGHCLGLIARENLDLVRQAHAMFVAKQRGAGLAIPSNAARPERPGGSPLRFLDCAVIRFLHRVLDDTGTEDFDTVRGLFPEGAPLYDQAGFLDRNRIQIAVCSPAAILGVFYSPEFAPGMR